MLSCCLEYREKTESKNPKVSKIKNREIMLLFRCTVCGSKKSNFIKEQEASALLNELGIKTPLRKITLLGDILLF